MITEKLNYLNKIPLNVATPIIKKSVCKYYNIDINDFNARTRKTNITIPRQIAHYIATFCKNTTLEKIGKNFGNKDHATVLYSKNEIKKYITPVNNKIVDNEILRALNWINMYIIKEFQNERIKHIKTKNRQKRIRFHEHTKTKKYYFFKKKYKKFCS